MFDIVVPVCNAMHHVRSCLMSVFRTSTLPSHLYVVNDNSTPYVSRALEELLAEYEQKRWTLLVNKRNEGYLRSVNRGARAGSRPYIVFCNSDTVVIPGHMEKLKADFEKDASIGVISAVSNWANWTRVCWRIPEGHNIMTLSCQVDQVSSHHLPDIGNASGFYFAVRRELFDKLNGFDEVYGFGYWEETDFCMRALDARYRVVVDDSLYIFHHGWGSFQEDGRNEQMELNKTIFMARWGERFREIEHQWKKKNLIDYLEPDVIEQGKDAPSALLAPKPSSKPYSQARRFRITEHDVRHRLKHITSLDRPLRELCTMAEQLMEKSAPSEHKRRVRYILPAVELYGGVISVLQVVNQLILLGYDANVVTYGNVDESVYCLFPTFFRAHRYDNMAAMVADFPDADMVVATAWETVYPAFLLKILRPNLRLLYFVQDYEPDFYTGSQADLEEKARRSYHLIKDQIVKTPWLGRKLEPFGGRVEQIPLGLNLDFFYDYGWERRPQVLALGRPTSIRRNFGMVCEVFAELHSRRPDIELALYGDCKCDNLPFPYHDYGKLTRMEEVAGALNESMLLLDCSTFQGFGRPGIEAMACGTSAVLTHEGGVTEYAKHEYNCLLIDPYDRDDILGKICELMDNPEKRNRLIQQGYQTAEKYSLLNEGKQTARLIDKLLNESYCQELCMKE